MEETCSTYYDSPVGLLKISGNDTCITGVLFWDKDKISAVEQPALAVLPAPVLECINQLMEYFHGVRRQFEIPIQQKGTPFQQTVWNELLNIPFGKTISYMQLSKRIGDVKAIRATASTNGKNNIVIIVPCHRVIGSNQQLVGFGGGLWRKKWLLEHENKIANGVQTLF